MPLRLLCITAHPDDECFAFGGALETARWMQKIAAGAFDLDASAGHFRLHD